MTKNIDVTTTLDAPIIISEKLNDLTITVASNQKAIIYQQNEVTDLNVLVRLEAGANLAYFTYHKSGDLDLDIKADLNQASKLSLYLMNSSIGQVNIMPRINLLKEGAKANLLSVFLSIGQTHLTCNSYINHEVPLTNSQIKTYAITKDDAKIIINNNTTIRNKAKNSNANQIIKGLNLSKKGHIEANPNLFIDEFDVIAHHGAAIGALNKDDLFYLMSRGIPEVEASKIIVMGFIQPLLDEIKNDDFKNEIMLDFIQKLK